MDCNKEQALEIKEAAERKFAEKDYVVAKELAQKAKDLYPGLEFISLLITVIDVYLSREKIGWYGVLGLEKTATCEKICANYYNLFADVKAGRNNVFGAEGALQIISEAFCFVTETFWTKCSKCQFRFHYCNSRINDEIVCFNCHERYVAVPLPSGSHPMNPRPMSHFQREKTDVVLALCAPSANSGGQRGQPNRSNRVKRDDKRCSMFGSPGDDDAATTD